MLRVAHESGRSIEQRAGHMTSSETVPIHDNLPPLLSEGYHAFWNGRLKEEQSRFRQLADDGQRPPVLLIGCCDSRVSPEVIFDAGPGEIFVVRNIAALIPPFEKNGGPQETPAAIEYAVLALKVAHIVIMGHAQCGGVRAFAQGEAHEFEPLSNENFVSRWKTLIKPAAARLGPPVGDFDHYCESLSYASIIQGISNLRTYPWLKEREDAGNLSLHGAYFGVANGRMTVLDQARGVFVPVIPGAN
jgi:carbonic anhydrase